MSLIEQASKQELKQASKQARMRKVVAIEADGTIEVINLRLDEYEQPEMK